jgi:type II secretory pathway pseudopilin PulG
MTLIELLVVVGILMVIMAFALPSAVRMTHQMRLRAATVDYQNLLQGARVRAIQDDRFYATLTQAATAVVPNAAYIDLAGNPSGTAPYAVGDPIVSFPAEIVPTNNGPGGLANLEGQFLPAGSFAVVQAGAAGPTFSSRGLPCVVQPGGTTCNSLNSGTPAAFITYFQNNITGDWMAVTVSPAARIRGWSYNAGNNTWTAMD